MIRRYIIFVIVYDLFDKEVSAIPDQLDMDKWLLIASPKIRLKAQVHHIGITSTSGILPSHNYNSLQTTDDNIFFTGHYVAYVDSLGWKCFDDLNVYSVMDQGAQNQRPVILAYELEGLNCT